MWLELALTIAIPFFFSGVVVSLALTRSPFPIGKVYAVDLIGAALGCIGVLLLLNYTDGPSAILWVAVIGTAAALFFEQSAIGSAPSPAPLMHGLLSHKKSILAGLLVFALANGLTGYGLQPLVVKGKFEGGASYLLREWNSFSRVALTWEKEGQPKMWGPSTKLPADLTVLQRNLNIDGGASTGAYRFSGDLAEVDFLRYDITNLTYHLPDRNSAAVIGVGGGRDVISAALFGYDDITGVELNPIFIDLLTERPGFADFTNVNAIGNIDFHVDDGRSWFARTDQQFDLIQMSLIDTWAATGAGAFSLSENGLYTVEAWKIFLDRLTPKGVYTVSRWHDEQEPTESARTVSLAVAALLAMGVEQPDQHIYLVTSGRVANIMVAREPFSAADLAALDAAVVKYDFKILASPAEQSEYEIFSKILSSRSAEELYGYTSGLLYDLTPATDDRPFFFNQLPLNKPIQAFQIAKKNIGARRMTGGVRQGNIVATATLLVLFFVCLLLVTATIVVPLRPALKDVGKKFVVGGTLYFLLIGIGFMMVEIGMLQRMSVFLGHPIYSLSVLLFTLILSTGIGSLLSDKFVLDTQPKLTVWALITGLYVFSLPYWLPGLLLDFDGASLLSRASLCVGDDHAGRFVDGLRISDRHAPRLPRRHEADTVVLGHQRSCRRAGLGRGGVDEYLDGHQRNDYDRRRQLLSADTGGVHPDGQSDAAATGRVVTDRIFSRQSG